MDENTPRDESIINVSSSTPGVKGDGYARPNDFNTATVAVTSDGRILSVESNLRRIVKSNALEEGVALLTPQQALNQFLTHNAQLSFTIPAGSGSVDWNKIYPNNKARAKKATITDYLLTYLEKPGSVAQDKLVPMYLIRGTAKLDSGFTVRFTETVPALRNNLSFLSPVGGVVAGVSSELAQGGIKLGTFTPYPTEFTQPTVTRTQNIPTVSSTASQQGSNFLSGQCLTAIDELQQSGKLKSATGTFWPEIVLEVPGLGQMTILKTYSSEILFKTATFPVSTLDEAREILFHGKDGPEGSLLGPVEKQFAINISRWLFNNPSEQSKLTSLNAVFSLFRKYNGSTCSVNSKFPPVPNCSPGQIEEKTYYDKDRIKFVSENVAKRVLSILQSGEVTQYAEQNDLFPTYGQRLGPVGDALIEGYNVPPWIFLLYNPGVYASSRGAEASYCYVTGVSPVLFFYPQTPTKVTVKLGSPVTYADPPFSTILHTVPAGRQGAVENSGWEAVAYPDGNLKIGSTGGGTFRSRLYYEYDKSKVSFTEPKKGFVVKYDNWEEFIRNNLAPQLGLNKKEMEALVVEVRNELNTFHHPRNPLRLRSGPPSEVSFRYLKISFIDRKELDKKLPVEITPKPDNFHHVHLLLTPISKHEEITQPTLKPIKREGFTVVELGAVVKK